MSDGTTARRASIVVASTLVAAGLAMAIAEVWVRFAWDSKRGTPGFFLSDPIRGERLADDYSGWFAGVPVRINRLGFRDPREYDLTKKRGTVRILVLGDSVTFGHGSIYERTYPYLLEGLLKASHPDIDWQVWNAGVPGYNTTQELAYLLEKGPVFKPDLVIVGFYKNDVVDNENLRSPGATARASSVVRNLIKRRLYSMEWYRRAYLQLVWRLRSGPAPVQAEGERLLENTGAIEQLAEQQLTAIAPVSADAWTSSRCSAHPHEPSPDPERTDQMLQMAARQDPGLGRWKAAVGRLQRMHREGSYRIVFFINMAPDICVAVNEDLFDTRGSAAENAYFLRVLGDGTPVVSSHDAFAQYRPSQVPQAGGHSLANANLVKAQVLFAHLSKTVLPALINRT
jgi:GDSL-like Lipase/Acylhydrolase family